MRGCVPSRRMDRTLTLNCSRSERIAWPPAFSGPDAEGPIVRLWVASLMELRPAMERFRTTLDEAELERAGRFRFEEDRERFIAGHGMMREVLGSALSADPASLRFERGAHGKPFIPGAGLRFSFSDTKDAVLIALSRDLEIGVDLETLSRRVDHDAVAGHYFTDAEVGMLSGLPEPERKRGFLELWTRKEAVLKATGVGIMDDLRNLSVLGPTSRMRITHPELLRMAEPAYHVRSWMIGDMHIASLAAPDTLDVEWREFRP